MFISLNENMPLQLVKNKKYGVNLIYKGFIYRYYRQGPNEFQWRCIHCNSSRCRSIYRTTTKTKNGS